MNRHKAINYIRKLDTTALNRMRMSVIVFVTLIFGNILYQGTFQSVSSSGIATLHNITKNTNANNDVIFEKNNDVIFEKNNDVSILASSTPLALPQNNTTSTSTSLLLHDASYARDMMDNFSAKSIIVTNQDGEHVLYAQDAGERLAMASLTKLMTAVIVLEYLDMSERITISKRALDSYGQAGGMFAGEQFIVSDLLNIMLIVSSNDAAEAFSDHFMIKGLNLISLMNEKAKEIGMSSTHFTNPSGLDADEHYSTAQDLALLSAYSLQYGMVWDILGRRSDTVISLYTKTKHILSSHNTLLTRKQDALLGSKTGYTDKALGCMISVLNDGTIIVVLGAQDRVDVTEKIMALVKMKNRNIKNDNVKF